MNSYTRVFDASSQEPTVTVLTSRSRYGREKFSPCLDPDALARIRTRFKVLFPEVDLDDPFSTPLKVMIAASVSPEVAEKTFSNEDTVEDIVSELCVPLATTSLSKINP